jgi:hypothetical protein
MPSRDAQNEIIGAGLYPSAHDANYLRGPLLCYIISMAQQYGLGEPLFDPTEAKIEHGEPPYLPKTLANKAVSSSYTDLVVIGLGPGHGRGTVGSIFGRKISCRKLVQRLEFFLLATMLNSPTSFRSMAPSLCRSS